VEQLLDERARGKARIAPLSDPAELRLALDQAMGRPLTGDFARPFKMLDTVIDPLTAELEGQKVTGKRQLYIDESRRFVEAALAENSPEGLAAAMAILMGMRASEITSRVVREVDDDGRVLWISRAKTPKGNRHLKVPTVLQPRLLALCARREPDERLFGEGRDRHWVYYHVQRICRLAKVPVVCTQGLRGTQSTISIEAVSVEHVAAALGQNGPRVTRRSYLAPGA
jgi:integrase